MKLLNRLRIKNKIIIIIMVAGAMSTIFGSAINFIYELHNSRNLLIDNSLLHTRLISENCWLPMEFNYPKDATEALDKLRIIEEVQDALLLTTDSVVFASYHRVPGSSFDIPGDFGGKNVVILGEYIYTKQVVEYNGKIYGVLYLRSFTNWNSIIASRLTISLVVIVIIIVLVYIFAYFLQGAISRPIIELSSQMAQVAKNKDYTLQLFNDSGDEIGVLYSEFNNMLAEINSKENERKKAFNQMIESERRIRAIFDLSFGFIGLLTPDGVLVDANNTALDFAGISRESVLGKPFVQTPWWNHSVEMQSLLKDAISRAAAGGVVRIEATHPAVDGTLHTVDFSLKPVMNDGGKVVLLIPEGRDISDLKKTQEDLIRESRFNNVIVNSSPVFIVVISTTGKVMMMNPVMLKATGYTADEIIGKDYIEVFVPPSDRQYGSNIFGQLTSSFKQTVNENKVIGKDGRLIDVEWHGANVMKESGIDYFIGFGTDISERKKTEAELAKYREQLEELVGERTRELEYSLSLVNAAMDSTADGILVVNRNGHITRWNQKFVDLWHVPGELLVTDIKDPVLHYALQQMADPEKFLSKVMELYDHPDQTILDTLYLADGRVFERFSQPQRLGDEIVGRVWSFRNITEQALAEENLRRAKDLAETANRAKSNFLANMSHEIRTPMNAVLGFAQLLDRDSSLSAMARLKVESILKSGEHLLGIINDILEVSRIEAGRVKMRNESVDLYSLLNEIAAMFRMQAEAKGLTFSVEIEKELPRYIVADLGKLRQVLINLLGNAVKFTPKGYILMNVRQSGVDLISISVEDSGIGISADEQALLFRPFERTRSGEQAAGGTGLGLVISREYAHFMGGEISLRSTVSQGSVFTFVFHAPSTSVIPTQVSSGRRVVGLVPGQDQVRVLVVDDMMTNRNVLRMLLESLGFVVDEAKDGEEAIAKAIEIRPRIILMDMVMPGINGIEATRIIRQTCPAHSTAIIGVSASAFQSEKQKFIDAGLNDFIAKPFKEQDLFNLIERHAEVLFRSEDVLVPSTESTLLTAPGLGSTPQDWRLAFDQALAQGSVSRIRQLGHDAAKYDTALSTYILDRVASYDLNGLKKLL